MKINQNVSGKPHFCTLFRRILTLTALIVAVGFGQAHAQRPNGIDVSRWQGTIDWVAVKGSGVTFAWAQATRGAYLTNVNFAANMSNGKAAGVLMGAYHFAIPATNSPAAEADYFWNLAGPYIVADGKTLMPMLDMETFTGLVGASSYSDWANQWYSNILAKAAAAGVTIKPVMYSSACSYCNMNSSSSAFGSWVANYSGADPQTATPWSACSGCNLWGGGIWNFWQYSSTGVVPGISGNVDLDVFNGTAAQLSTWVATAAAADTTPPVLSAVASSAINDTSATITWTTDENADSVVEYGTTTSYGLTASSASMVLHHSIGLSGLSASTLYHYRVKSRDAANNLATSGDFTFTTLAPGAVADIIIDNPAASITGSWSTGTSSTDKFGGDYRYKSGAGGSSWVQFTPNILTAGNYQVYEWHPAGSNRTIGAQEIVSYNGGSQTFTINQQVNGGTWNLLGTFNFASGTSGSVKITDGHTDTANVVMADAIKFVYVTPAAPPSGLSATAVSSSQINLSWTASAGAASYKVKRATVSGGPYTTIATGVTVTSFSDTALTAGTTYYYVVSAVNSGGESANSSQASTTTQPPPIPPVPTGLSATAGNAQVALSWTVSTGATSYNIKRATVSGGPYTTIATGVSATSYTDTTAANGTTYYYVVSAVNTSGESANSAQVSATPSAPTGPPAPTGFFPAQWDPKLGIHVT